MNTTPARSVYEKMMERDFCSQWMGIEAVEVAEGYCKIKMTVRREMLNGYGILHGGIAFAFADSAFAFAANSYGRIAVSLNGSMSYARPAREGEALFAEAKTLHLAHKTGEFEVQVKNSRGETYYFFRGTVYRKSTEVLDENKK